MPLCINEPTLIYHPKMLLPTGFYLFYYFIYFTRMFLLKKLKYLCQCVDIPAQIAMAPFAACDNPFPHEEDGIWFNHDGTFGEQSCKVSSRRSVNYEV